MYIRRMEHRDELSETTATNSEIWRTGRIMAERIGEMIRHRKRLIQGDRVGEENKKLTDSEL